MKRNRINIRVSDELWENLKVAASGHGSTMTAIIETALQQYFCPDDMDRRETQILSRLDRYDARHARLETDLRLCTETLGHYVLYWLTKMEPIPQPERDAAYAVGRRRYEQFIEGVAERMVKRG